MRKRFPSDMRYCFIGLRFLDYATLMDIRSINMRTKMLVSVLLTTILDLSGTLQMYTNLLLGVWFMSYYFML